MHISCCVCGSYERPMGVPKPDEDTTKFCSDSCEQTFQAWTKTGSAMSLFGFYLRRKYPQQEASP